MYGMVPSGINTFEVAGDFNSTNLKEGKLYWDPETKILCYYSTTETRSNPSNGYLPIWNGKSIIRSKNSKTKKYPDDVIIPDAALLVSKMNSKMASQVEYFQRRMDKDKKLTPKITPEDNMFTQCIKGVLLKMDITMIDLHDMAAGKLANNIVENYYTALNSITMMRQEKWQVWISVILKMTYSIIVSKDNKELLCYDSSTDSIDTGIVRFESVVKPQDDPLKKIVKILIAMNNITKNSLKRPEVNAYSINNLFTAINGDKMLSAQLFSRFLRMAEMSYKLILYKDGEEYFEYQK